VEELVEELLTDGKVHGGGQCGVVGEDGEDQRVVLVEGLEGGGRGRRRRREEEWWWWTRSTVHTKVQERGYDDSERVVVVVVKGLVVECA